MPQITVSIRPMPFKRVRTRGKHFFNDPSYTEYKKILGHAMHLWHHGKGHRTPFDGPLKLELTFTFKHPKKSKNGYPRGDSDNLAKAIADAGNKILWNDDDQIVELWAKKAYGECDSVGISLFNLPLPITHSDIGTYEQAALHAS